jgi:hypothetical protein
VTTDVTGAALKEVFGEVRRLQTEAPDEEEAAGMRTWMAGTFVLQNASPGGLIGGLSFRDFTACQPTGCKATFRPSLASRPRTCSASPANSFRWSARLWSWLATLPRSGRS